MRKPLSVPVHRGHGVWKAATAGSMIGSTGGPVVWNPPSIACSRTPDRPRRAALSPLTVAGTPAHSKVTRFQRCLRDPKASLDPRDLEVQARGTTRANVGSRGYEAVGTKPWVLIWRFLCPVGRVRQPLQPSLEGLPLPLTSGPVTSVSMSTRGHSHMRGLVAAGRVVRRERYRGSRNERGPVRAAHSTVAGSLLTLPSPAPCSSTDALVRGAGP